MLPIDKMIITHTFTMANCGQKVRGNKPNQRPKQQQKQTNKQNKNIRKNTTNATITKTTATTKREEGAEGEKANK